MVMVSAVRLSVALMLSVVMLNVTMLSVVMLNVVMLRAVTPMGEFLSQGNLQLPTVWNGSMTRGQMMMTR